MNALPTNDLDIMYMSPYGSRLYGTFDAESDHDYKAVYLPAIDDLLLGRKLEIQKLRVDADGNRIGSSEQMPADGLEVEYIPFQTFVRDFVQGQTYAIELAHAIYTAGPAAPTAHDRWEWSLVEELISTFSNSNLLPMVGFAQKQTFDYIHRAERLNRLLSVLETIQRYIRLEPSLRLDDYLNGTNVLDLLAADTQLPIGSSANGHRTQRTLELNGRSYLESTSLNHLEQRLLVAIDKYGHRVQSASEQEIDWKSLSHAVRVYSQVIDLCETKTLKFPFDSDRIETLVKIKKGQLDFERVREMLVLLESDVKFALQTSALQPLTPELVQRSEKWLVATLRELYGLQLCA